MTNLQNVNTGQGSGIYIDYSATDIKIGAPGKGNVIGGTINGILIQNTTYIGNIAQTKITIQSNLIGVLYDGTTAIPNVNGISANLYECNLDIGGDNAGDGNVIAANQTNININRSYSSATRLKINIVNNKIGADYTGTKDFHELPLFLSSSSIEIHGVKVNAAYTDLYIRNNIISGNRTWATSIANADFVMTGNAIGTGTQGTEKLGNGGGVRIIDNARGIIGGATTAEANKIGYNNFGIESTSIRDVKITHNSMFCNKVFGIGKSSGNPQPFIQILKKRSDYVSGKATPNSEVELFYTENCEGICEGRTYIRTVQAGSDGRWEYSGALTGSVTATASLLNQTTSPFSTAELLPNEAVIEPVTCNGNGSIKIPEPREGMTFTWNKIINNGTRVFLGSTQEITGLDVGAYEVIIDDGCKAIAQQFEIKDQKLTDPVVTLPVPSCGQLTFQFSAEVFRGKGTITYQWLNEAGTVVATGKTVSLPEGTYKVRVTDEANCVKESALSIIKRLPTPIINLGSMQVAPAACGQENGSIKNITVSDVTGTATYKWFVYDYVKNATTTTVAGTSLNLENVQGGYYVLQVSDGG
ncbi:MAG: gliding motility-associated C-terminal domain-containing protein, partial [Pedobacter sp.]|nr:gliding motility-associated C-terminal domain-containing protein [Pedobacter sp.]